MKVAKVFLFRACGELTALGSLVAAVRAVDDVVALIERVDARAVSALNLKLVAIALLQQHQVVVSQLKGNVVAVLLRAGILTCSASKYSVRHCIFATAIFSQCTVCHTQSKLNVSTCNGHWCAQQK